MLRVRKGRGWGRSWRDERQHRRKSLLCNSALEKQVIPFLNTFTAHIFHASLSHTHTRAHRKMLTKFHEDGKWTFFSKETHHIATSSHRQFPSHSLSLARLSLSLTRIVSTRKINVAWRVSSRRRKGGKQKERTFAFQYSFSHSLPIPAVFSFPLSCLFAPLAFTYISVVIFFRLILIIIFIFIIAFTDFLSQPTRILKLSLNFVSIFIQGNFLSNAFNCH